MTILCPQKEDLNWWGYLKPRARGGRGNARKEDLFISLAGNPDQFAAEYEARCSTARFKAGRHQLKGGVYDLVVSDTAPEPVAMKEAFEVIEKMLNNIK